ELVWRPGERLRPIRGGHTQIVQILMNLAVNARDAMPDGGELIIETRSGTPDAEFARRHPGFPDGTAVFLCVADTGTGMDAETQAHIFEPFYTTKTVGRGTGLGLATVMQIVKQHGAVLDVESAPGAGSVFTIVFPAAEGDGEAAAPADAEAGDDASDGIILVVEDEPPVRELACELLKLDGYTVIEAASASEAERFSEQFGGHIHLLLSDVIMPRMSGPDLYERLKRRRPGLEVLYMSGYTDDRIGEKGLSDSSRLLRKPFSRSKLLKTVRAVLTASAAGANQPDAD
ncbi:MAG: ATP-binding protein, partial [Planctomycetota bacterium]